MTIELPNKGQAIDSTYLLKLINTVNELEAKVTARPNNLSTVYVRAENKASQSKSSDLLFSAVQTKITNSNTSAVTEIKQRVPFEISFKNPPIVTATIEVPIGTSITSKDISVYVSDVETSSANITVNFRTTDSSSVLVNVIAVGLQP